jgi:hypothetical protein
MGRGGSSSVAETLCAALDDRSVPYVVVRGCGLFESGTAAELCLLVGEGELGRAADVARKLGFTREDGESSSGAGRAWMLERGEHGPLRVRLTEALSYGGGMATTEPDRLLLGRRRRSDGVAVAANSDELIDLVLHCVLEARSFEPEHRARLQRLMAELRGHPPDAGRAAIRVQTELAPALPWSDLLAAIVQERWDDLLARRGRLARRLRRRWPDHVIRRVRT